MALMTIVESFYRMAIANPLVVQAEDSSPREEEIEREVILVGLIAESVREIPSVFVRGLIEDPEPINFRDWQVPYESVIAVLNFTPQPLGEEVVQLNAPGLVTRLNLNELATDPELGLVLSIAQIEEKFQVQVEFDLNRYAIVLSADWLGQRRSIPRGFARQREPQLEGLPKIEPAFFTLTTTEQVTRFTPAIAARRAELEGDLIAIGTLWGGSWRLEIEQPNLEQSQTWQLDRAQYFRPTPQADLIIGEQAPFWIEQGQGEYWGVTYLQREGVEPPSLEASNVNPEQRLRTDVFRRDITGEAEPGTLVQLTRDRGREVLEEVLVDVDGIYRFEDVPFGGRRFQNEYDVLLFRQGQLTLDPEMRTVSFRPRPEQLSAGSFNWLISAGARREQGEFWGQFLDWTGGATVRWGITDSLTVGTGLIQDQEVQGWGELFFRPLNFPLDVAIAGIVGNDLETRIEYEITPHLNLNFNSDRLGSNLRTTWQITPAFRSFARWDSEQGKELGLRGRFGKTSQWATNWEVRLDEANQLQWQIRQTLGNLELKHQDRNSSTSTELSYQLFRDLTSNAESRLNLDYETRRFNETEQLMTLSWEYRSAKRDLSNEPLWDLEVGYGIGSQGEGMIADVETNILPGLRLRGRYQGISLGSAEDQLSFELTTRLNWQRGISPGDRAFDDLQTQGGILVQPFFDNNNNGRLDDHETVYTEAQNLLVLNGEVLRPSQVNQQRDRLLVTVPPNQYRLTLDPAGFPLDWQASNTTFAVTVVSGTYTPLTVPLTRSYTVSGILTDENNQPIGGARVVAIPEGEGSSRFSITNQGGVYFLEQLQQGTYQLQVREQSVKPSMITIDGSSPPFQQQNLVLPSGE